VDEVLAVGDAAFWKCLAKMGDAAKEGWTAINHPAACCGV